MLSRYPIIGDRWQCLDCPERVGFDLCAACYEKRADVVGRFNQHHKAGVVPCSPVHADPAQKQATYTHPSKLCMLQHRYHADSQTQAIDKMMCICRSQDEAGAHYPKLPARAPGMPAVFCSKRSSPSASHPVAVGGAQREHGLVNPGMYIAQGYGMCMQAANPELSLPHIVRSIGLCIVEALLCPCRQQTLSWTCPRSWA